MGVAAEVNCTVKRTFLEFSAGDVTEKVGRGRAQTDTDLLASAGLIVRTAAPSSGEAIPDKKLAPEIPETPMLDAIFEPSVSMASMENMDQWMLPMAAVLPEEMSCQWAFMPCGDYMEYCAQQQWGEWPCSESTETGSTTGESDGAFGGGWRTTVMLRNLPRNLTRDMLLQLLEEKGFSWQYDLVYLPVDFSTGVGLGYAFVNSSAPECVKRLWEVFDGLSEWPVESDKVCTVSWSDPHQGLYSHIERYRNSPVMHPSVPDEWKPALFMHGMRVEFPHPTTKVKAPKVRGKKNADKVDDE